MVAVQRQHDEPGRKRSSNVTESGPGPAQVAGKSDDRQSAAAHIRPLHERTPQHGATVGRRSATAAHQPAGAGPQSHISFAGAAEHLRDAEHLRSTGRREADGSRRNDDGRAARGRRRGTTYDLYDM